jgi:multidrug efflux pump subunit AcrB
MSFGSYAALFAVFGIAASSCILLFDRLRKREQAGEAFGPDLVVDVAGERFVPVLTTALATALALPFAVLGNMPNSNWCARSRRRFGGLVCATVSHFVRQGACGARTWRAAQRGRATRFTPRDGRGNECIAETGGSSQP